MNVGETTFLTYLLRYRRQRDGLGHSAAALPNLLCDLLVRVPVTVAQGRKAVGLLPGRQVFPLHVLYEGYLGHALLVHVQLYAGDFAKSRGLRRRPTAPRRPH